MRKKLGRHGKKALLIMMAFAMVFSGMFSIAPQASADTSAIVYEVGPGRAYENIGDVPLESLNPGDTVRIHYRATPYKEKFIISRMGTESQPITIQGVPGPNGELPVIDGNGATTRPQLDYWNERRGVINIGGARFAGSASNPAGGVLPKHIIIENLEIKNGHHSYNFKDNAGTTKTYNNNNAAALFIEYGENIIIRNNIITGSGNGLFAASSDTGQTKNLLVEGNYIYGNGNPNRNTEHNIYTAAVGITFQNNRIGDLCSGCNGNALKDRSAGTVIRYNHITGGNRAIDLVEGEDSSAIRNHPDYSKTYVYGNVITELQDNRNRQIIHYGGDLGNAAWYRKGMLHLYNNTFITERTEKTSLVRLSTADESADIRNNIIYKTNSASELGILEELGTAYISHNWISPFIDSMSGGGTVVNDNTQISGASPDFVNLPDRDVRLSATSNAIDAGTSLHADAAANYQADRQYVLHQSSETRPNVGVIDIGAYEFVADTSATNEMNVAVGADNTITLTFPEAMSDVRGEVAILDPFQRKIATFVSSPDAPALFAGPGKTAVVLAPAATGLAEVNSGQYALELKYWHTAGGAPLGEQILPFTANDTKRPALDPLFYVVAGTPDKVSLYFDEAMDEASLSNLSHYVANGTPFSDIAGVEVSSISADKSTITFDYPNASTALVAGTGVITAQSVKDAAGNTVREDARTAARRTSTTLAFAQSHFDIRYNQQARNVIQVADKHTVVIRFNTKIASAEASAWQVQRHAGGSTWNNFTTFTSARILPDGYTVAFTAAAPLELEANRYRLTTQGNANTIQNIYGSTRPSGNQSIWFDLVRPEVKSVEQKSGVDNVIEAVFTKGIIGFDAADFVVYDGAQKLQANQDYYVERVKPDTFEITVKSSQIGLKAMRVGLPAPAHLVDGFRNRLLPSGKVYEFDLGVSWYPEPSGESVKAIWGVNDGESIRRDDLNNPNKLGNSAWDGQKVKLFGGRNEVLAFQRIVESGAGGIDELSLSLPSLNQVGGSGGIAYTPPAADPTLYAGRPIQIFSQHYMNLHALTTATWVLPTSGVGKPADPSGIAVPDQLVPENALPGKGGFPLQVLPNRNQGIWFEVYTAKNLPAGTYAGTVNVNVNGTAYQVPVELELFDFTLPDENTVDIMVYYEDDQINRYHQPESAEEYRALQDSYRRFLHRNRVEFVSGTTINGANLNSEQYIQFIKDNVRWYDGTAFTLENGYDGPGAGIGSHIIPRTMYGPGTEFDEAESAQAKSDEWMNFLNHTFGEGSKQTFLYMPDEPSSSQYPYIKQIAKNIKTGTGPGKDLPILVTTSYNSNLANDSTSVAPGTNNVIDIWLSYTRDYKQADATAQRALGNQVNAYNGQRPFSGVAVHEVPATDMRATMWGVLKQDMNSFFYWHSNHWWHNSSLFRGLSRYQNPWVEPVTFRNASDGFANGDGVIMYPGRDAIDPAEDRGIDGPISSIRMSNIRRGIQDLEYMEMLKKLGKDDDVAAIMQARIPSIFNGNPGATLGFSQTGNEFEGSRYEMALMLNELLSEPDPEQPELGSKIEGPSTAYAGQSFELTVGIEGSQTVSDFTTLDVIVNYDPSKVEFATAQGEEYPSLAEDAIHSLRDGLQVLGTAIKARDGEIRILMATGGGSISGNGPLFKLIGKVRSDAAVGATTISLSDFEIAFTADAREVEGASLDIQIELADKTALTAAIAAAETLHDHTVVGSAPGNYPKAAKDAFAAAIAAANTVLLNAEASQAAVNEAAATLAGAVAVFRAAVVTHPDVNRSNLVAAIQLAEQRHADAAEGGKVGQYEASARQTLRDAINAANAVRYNGTASQAQVNEAETALRSAIQVFLDQVITLVPNGKRVSVRDLSVLVQYWGVTSADSNWNEIEKADVIGDGVIDLRVLAAIARMILDDWMKE